jgi:hypothetical protein
MPAGAVCPCGALTTRPSKKCERCEGVQAAKRDARSRIYSDRRWRRTKIVVWVRDNWTCRSCGARDIDNRGRTLDAHHLVPVLELVARGGDPFDPALVETRCKRCHGGVR